ncbi:MAG: hypothetical protein ACOCTK_03695 [Candidatus Saliniplasma sp.]
MSFLLCVDDGDNIPRKISEENKVRMMVLPIIAMLTVTMVITGCLEEDEPIEWEEGYDEITVEVPPPPEEESNMRTYYENESYRAISRSYVNGEEGYLELETSPWKWIGDVESGYWVGIELEIKGEFPSQYSLDELILQAQVIDGPAIEGNNNNWLTGTWDSEGLDLWEYEKNNPGSVGEEKSFIGADVEDNNFSYTNVRLTNEHPYKGSLVEEPITLEIKAILRGLGEEVTATTRVSFTQEGL